MDVGGGCSHFAGKNSSLESLAHLLAEDVVVVVDDDVIAAPSEAKGLRVILV